MPRTKEAIATVRTYARFESKQKVDGLPTVDAIYAQGVLAALKWMTQQDAACPYSDLEEDFEDGGWEVGIVPAQASAQAPPPPVSIPQFESRIILPGEEPPDPNAGKKLVVPDRFLSALEEQPWLKAYLPEVVADMQSDGARNAELRNDNAVVVGAGLDDQPRLAGGGWE